MKEREKKPPQTTQRQSLTTSHKQTSAQTFPEWWLPWKIKSFTFFCYPSFNAEHDITQYGPPHLFNSGQRIHSQTLVHAQCTCWTGHGGSGKKRKPWYYASTAQQQPKCWLVINTFLVIGPIHSTIQAATKKVNSIPARLSTGHLEFRHQLRHVQIAQLWVSPV